MSDRIILSNMVFSGRHGVTDEERTHPQPFQVDVELFMNLRPAGVSDDIAETVDYRSVFEVCKRVIEGESHLLLEALAHLIAQELLGHFAAPEVVVRVRKPEVQLGGQLDYSGVEIHRSR